MTGHDYADLIAHYLVRNFGSRNLVVYREVQLGKTIIGKNRRVDILALRGSDGLAIECKFQATSGTTEEKMPYTLQDMSSLRLDSCVAYAGEGFSAGIRHMLAASPIAAYCLPDLQAPVPSASTRELDHILAATFGWWDVVVSGRRPFSLPD